MSYINTQSILAKAKACMTSDGWQKKIEQKVDSVIAGGGYKDTINGRKVTAAGMSMAAAKFIEVLQNEINGSNIGISGAISLEHSSPYKVGKNKYQVEIWFSNNLHRDSLLPSKYSGVDNIVALFNNGYSAGNTVYGIWHGKEIASLKERTGIHFIDSAVRNYMGNYASEYGIIDIKVDPIYQ